MIRDRMPDLLALARKDPTCHEPEVQPTSPIRSDLKIIFDRASKVSKYLHEMQRMMWRLDKLHDTVLTSTSFAQERDCRQQIQAMVDRYSALARKTRSILQRMQMPEDEMQKFSALEGSSISQVETNGKEITFKWQKQSEDKPKVTWHQLGSSLLPLSNTMYIPAETRIAFHLHNILDYRLSMCVRDYYIMQKLYSDRCRSKMHRQLSIIGRDVDDNEVERAIEVGETIPLLHHNIVDDSKVRKQMQAALLEAETLHHEIISLEKSIETLHKSFLMVWTLVHEQGEIVDRIENHVDLAADYVERSNSELKKASNFQHKYRKKKCFLAIFLAIVITILIVIIVISVKMKQNKTNVYVKPGRLKHPTTTHTHS